MQKYVLDRNGNTLATFASEYNDKHTKTLDAGASVYEFTISKQDEAALFLETGNYINFVDDIGKPWSFTISSFSETHYDKTVYCEDVGIELINKNVNSYKADTAYSFAYYFEMITKNTPWKIGVNEISNLSRKLEWTSNDTGLSRLLSLLTEFDNSECKFNVKFNQNKPTEFRVDIYKQLGNPNTNVQIVYSNELTDIKKTESRTEFVTAIQGEGGTPTKNPDGSDIVTGTNPDGTPIETPKITFVDIEYEDDNFVSHKGDNFLRAITANKLFNPNAKDVYLEGYYSYDTVDPKELLNRTLTQLKKYSSPQYMYEADVQIIDKNLDLGDTVKIIDHDYNPGLYLSARVASLEKSYTDPSKNTITFTNYKLVNSSLAQKLLDLQNIVNSMPNGSDINNIVTNVINNSTTIEDKILAITSADGRSTVYYDNKPSDAKEGDTAFVKNPDSGNMEIWNFVDGQWTLTSGDSTYDDLRDEIEQAQKDADQAVAKANDAVNKANQAVEDAGFANTSADEALKQVNGFQSSIDGMQSTVNENGELVSILQNTVNGIKGTVADNTGKITTIEETVNGIQLNVDDELSGMSTQITALAGQITSVVENGATKTELAQTADYINLRFENSGSSNLCYNSEFKGKTGWTSESKTDWYITDGEWGGNDLPEDQRDHGAGMAINRTKGETTYTDSASQMIGVGAGTKYSASIRIYRDVLGSGSGAWGEIEFLDANKTRIKTTIMPQVSGPKGSSNTVAARGYALLKLEDIPVPEGTKYLRISSILHGNGHVKWQHPMLVRGTTVSGYSADTGSALNQINIDSTGVLIAGEKVHITGKTTIDNGIITNAMIGNATIDSAKIKDVSITNAKIANIDGGKITANSITADKLAVNSLLVGLNNALGVGMNLSESGIEFKRGGATSYRITGDGIGMYGSTIIGAPTINGIGLYGNVAFNGVIYPENSASTADSHIHFRNAANNEGFMIVNDQNVGIIIKNSGSVWAQGYTRQTRLDPG